MGPTEVRSAYRTLDSQSRLHFLVGLADEAPEAALCIAAVEGAYGCGAAREFLASLSRVSGLAGLDRLAEHDLWSDADAGAQKLLQHNRGNA